MTDRIELVRLLVPAYKNLRDVVIPWTSGVTLIGANGAGKTNLLETMALLFGTDETLDRSSDRLALPQHQGCRLWCATMTRTCRCRWTTFVWR